MIWFYHRSWWCNLATVKEFLKSTFRASVLTKGLTLEISAVENIDGGQFTLSTRLIKANNFEYSSQTWLGWNLFVSSRLGIMNTSLSIFACIFCRAVMVFSLEGRECRSPWGMTILSWLSGIFRGQVLGTPNRGYKVPGRVCPENPDSAATKFWARRT